MEKAIYNGEYVYAHKIAELDEAAEHEFRKDTKGKLLCINPECDSPQLMYCHGNVKLTPYFAHVRRGEKCDLAEFEKENEKNIYVQHALTERFRSQGYACDVEVKKIKNHYSNILIQQEDYQLAVDLVSDYLSAGETDLRLDQYAEAGINTRWIVVSPETHTYAENETNQIRRHLLNVFNGYLIVITPSGQEVVQTKVYELDGKKRLYTEKSDIPSLVIDGNEITIKGFKDRYNAHKNAEEHKIKVIKAKAIQELRRRELSSIIRENVKNSDIRDDSLKEELWANILQQFEKQYISTTTAELLEDETEYRNYFESVLAKKLEQIALAEKEERKKKEIEEKERADRDNKEYILLNDKIDRKVLSFMRKNPIANRTDREINYFIDNQLLDVGMVALLDRMGKTDEVTEIKEDYREYLYNQRKKQRKG